MKAGFYNYTISLLRYFRLSGIRETFGLIVSIIGNKLLFSPRKNSLRFLQRWSFFQKTINFEHISVIQARPTEFIIKYFFGYNKSYYVDLALRMPECDSSDARVFEQIFLMNDYALVLEWFAKYTNNNEIKTVLDIGANIGCATLFFCTQLPSLEIFCLEPEESNYQRLLLNLELNPEYNVRSYRAALWVDSGTLKCTNDFRDCKEWGARFVEYSDDEDEKAQKVTSLNILELEKKSGFNCVDFLKMDIEGAEADLIRNPDFINFLREKVKRISIEVHEEFISIDEVSKILYEVGFKTNKVSEFVCGIKSASD